jgi:hypothetical protein
MDRRHRKRAWKNRSDCEIRFRCGLLLYEKGESGERLSEMEFACAFKRSVYLPGPRWNGVRFWLAHAVGDAEYGGARGALFDTFEVIVVFPHRIRVARSSTRLSLDARCWTVSVTEVPATGSSLRGFFGQQIRRFSSAQRVLFGGGDPSKLFPDGVLQGLRWAKVSEDYNSFEAENLEASGATGDVARSVGHQSDSLEGLAAEVHNLRQLVGAIHV